MHGSDSGDWSRWHRNLHRVRRILRRATVYCWISSGNVTFVRVPHRPLTGLARQRTEPNLLAIQAFQCFLPGRLASLYMRKIANFNNTTWYDYGTKYEFKNGLPKIHEHDASPSQAFGIVIDGRLVLLYTFESDIGDGWEDAEVHNDSEQIRLKALQMGANILEYAFTN